MFKNPNQRKFLFAMDSDKKKGMNPNGQVSSSNPQLMIHAQGLGVIPPVPKLSMPEQHINPTGVPALPALGKLPKFGKMKNSLKGQFKSK